MPAHPLTFGPFPTNRPTSAEVEKWLDGRSITEACLPEREVEELLGLPRNRLARIRRVRSSGIPYFRFGGKVWYSREGLQEFLAAGGDLNDASKT